MPNCKTTFPSDEDDDETLPRIPHRSKRNNPRFISSEFAFPDNYKEYRRAGIPDNPEQLVEEFLKQFPSHEELAWLETKGVEIARWLNQQLYEIERICLRTNVLTENFRALEENEVLITQLYDASSTVRLLQKKLEDQQSRLDDQLLPWLTKSNFKKSKFPSIAFLLIVISIIFFVRHGSSNPAPNPTPTTQPTSAPAKPSPNR